jgi:hypothetical protein
MSFIHTFQMPSSFVVPVRPVVVIPSSFSKFSPSALVCRKSLLPKLFNRFSDLGFLLNLVPGYKAVHQEISNLLAGAMPTQSVAFNTGSKAVRRIFASPLAFLDDVVDFPRTFLVVRLGVAVNNKGVPTEVAMSFGSIK